MKLPLVLLTLVALVLLIPEARVSAFMQWHSTNVQREQGDETVPHQLFVPRVLVDIGPLFSMPKNQLHLGFEWQYWHNKFGIEGISESVPQIQIKWTF